MLGLNLGQHFLAPVNYQQNGRQQKTSFKMIPMIVNLLLALSSLSSVFAGLCPPGCQCDNKGLSTVCSKGELTIIPHFLNPAIRSLKANNNKIRKLEGSLNYYNKVVYFIINLLYITYKLH